MAIDAAIAMNRFGFGAKAGEAPPDKPQDWLLAQLGRYDPNPPAIAALPDRSALFEQLEQINAHRKEDQQAKAENRPSPVPPEFQQRAIRLTYATAVDARLRTMVASDTSFAERLVQFWSNHFAVSIDNPQVTQLAGNYEFTAIRPHIMGNFGQLLVAAETHPAMLVFLNQVQSIGPDSAFAQRVNQRPWMRNRQKFGLNENLGRETMELHTLGVRTVYTQADVIELAKAYTGLTIAQARGPIGRLLRNTDFTPGETVFIDQFHEPGTRTIIGKRYPQQGRAQLAAVLQELAVHPATAHHISFELARHFVADNPPAALVERMQADFLRTGGDLPSLYRTMITSPEAWEQPFSKFKTPWDWMVSTLRLTGMDFLPNRFGGPGGRRRQGRQGRPGNQVRQAAQTSPDMQGAPDMQGGPDMQGAPQMQPMADRQYRPMPAAGIAHQLGQDIWKPGSPAGYGDTQQDWAGSGALMQRVNLAGRLSQRIGNTIDARSLATQALPGVLSPTTSESIARAADPAQGLALLLLSPEFLRR